MVHPYKEARSLIPPTKCRIGTTDYSAGEAKGLIIYRSLHALPLLSPVNYQVKSPSLGYESGWGHSAGGCLFNSAFILVCTANAEGCYPVEGTLPSRQNYFQPWRTSQYLDSNRIKLQSCLTCKRRQNSH